MTIFVATDFSENSESALRLGARLAKAREQALILFHCVDFAAGDDAWRMLVQAPDEIERSAAEEARRKLEEFLKEVLPDAERPEEVCYHVAVGNPVDEILRHARKFSEPLILAGALGKSRFREFFLGSTAHRLVQKTTAPVILTPANGELGEIERVVVALDLSPVSREALRQAAALARDEGAELSIAHGFALPEVAALQNAMVNVTAELDRIVAEKKRAIEKLVEEEGVSEEVEKIEIIEMPPASAILTAAEDAEAQMIVIGSHGRRGWSRFFLGNTAERILRRSKCPIFVIPAPREEA